MYKKKLVTNINEFSKNIQNIKSYIICFIIIFIFIKFLVSRIFSI